jgi:hypothetical protein
MRSVLLLTPALLVACATAPAQPVVPGKPIVHGETPGHTCTTAGTEQFIGQPGTAETGAAILRVSNAAQLRWAPVGYMITMDFSADRVTVWLDEHRKVSKVSCG